MSQFTPVQQAPKAMQFNKVTTAQHGCLQPDRQVGIELHFWSAQSLPDELHTSDTAAATGIPDAFLASNDWMRHC